MTYDGFVLYCFTQGINQDVIKACRTAVMADDYVLDRVNKHPQSSLGYAELSDIDTIEKAIKEIKETIWMSVCDYDARGRSLEKVRLRQLIKNPNKGLTRRVLKAYYLLGGKPD